MNSLFSPDMVTWEITERCNMHCRHCSNAVNGLPFELDTADCKRIIDKISEAKIFKVGIEGGEPLIRRDLVELITYMNKKKIRPSIATNGTLLDANFIDRLKSCSVDAIQISLDGSDKDSYAIFRGESSRFDLILQNVKLAIKNELPITIAMVVSKSTYKQIPEMVKLAQSLGVTKLRFIDYVPSGRGQTSDCLSAEELRSAYSSMSQIEHKGLQIVTPNKLMSLLSQTTEETLLGLINSGTCFGCEAGTVIAHIRANGDLFPCSFFRDPIFCAGNILQNSLQSIWATSEAFYPLRKITNIPEKCKDCKKTIAVSEDAERMHTIQPVVCRMQILDVGGSNVY